MKNRSLQFKLFALSGFLILVAMAVGIAGRWASAQITAKYSQISDVNMPNLENTLEMDGHIKLATLQLAYLTLPGTTAEENNRAISALSEDLSKLDKNFKDYEAVPSLPGEEEIYNDLKKKVELSRKNILHAVELFNKSSDPNSAERRAMIEYFAHDVRDSAREVRLQAEKLRQFHFDDSQKNKEAAKQAASLGMWISLLTLLVGSICGGVFAFFFSNSLVQALRAISDSLSHSSAQVSSASTQIAASSQQLSQAATEQAASLEETASSIEEMSAMVKKNSDNAKSTASVSAESQSSAERGRQAMEKMLQSMDAINRSNEVIMQQIEHSNNQFGEIVKVINEIGTKTKVINDIVFQTKLLSFNASVEAARAGEHGKGFAVVAEEVGNLAAMSGNAAKEITSLLESSTQKVEHIVEETKTKVSSLMVDGKAKLEEGTGVAKQCSEILGEIVKNVGSVSQMSGEIATASEEQSRGVHEITKAMGQLDAVTQTNAATSEEAASAAEELSAQAEALRGLVVELVATVNGRGINGTLAGSAPGSNTGTGSGTGGFNAPARSPEAKAAKVISMPVKSASPTQMKKAAGAEDVPSYEDSRFTEV